MMKDFMRCANCDRAISKGPLGWVHEDADQKSCACAAPKQGWYKRLLDQVGTAIGQAKFGG